MSINQRRVQRPLNKQTIAGLHYGKPVSAPGDRRNGQIGQVRHNTGQAAQREAKSPAPKPAWRNSRPAVPTLVNPLRKGQKFPLEASCKLSRIKACLGWNTDNPACEADVSAFLLQNGRVPGDAWFVFYGQDRSPDGSTAFYPKADPDREMITIDFDRLDPRVDKIVLILTINEALSKRLNFSMLRDTYIRLINPLSNQEIASFQIEEYYSNVTSMVIGEIYRHNGAWKFNAVGNGVGRDLAGLCEMYGVQVE